MNILSFVCASLFLGTGDPTASEFGYLSQPAYSTDKVKRGPVSSYQPQAGDIVLFSNPNIAWETAYLLAKTGKPGHSGLVVCMKDGQLGILEAGFEDTLRVKITPVAERFAQYKGTIWIRSRLTPITEEQSCRLTEFAHTIDGKRYSVARLLLQLTPFRNRGPIRTIFFGKPQGIRSSYICSEAVLEGLVYAGLLDCETTRPSATFPKDIFYDHSLNWYINKHLRLYEQWQIPALWHRCP